MKRQTSSARSPTDASPTSAIEERRALPGVVAVGLGDGRAEAAADLLLDRLQVLSLALEVVRLAEVEAGLDQADERHTARPS